MAIKEKILKIMSLALEIDPPEGKNGGETRTSVSVRWSPYSNLVEVNICFEGLKDSVSTNERYTVAINPRVGSKGLNRIISRLEIIKNGISETESNYNRIAKLE